jgi:ATP-binding cassette subfamily B protein
MWQRQQAHPDEVESPSPEAGDGYPENVVRMV